MSDARGAIAHGVTAHPPPKGWDDTVTLTVGNQVLTGWQRVSVVRHLAGIPASFDLQVTEKYPNVAEINVQPGQPCTIKIGADLVLTGYVDRYAASVNPAMHTIRISGRSMSEDLVDCSAVFGDIDKPGFQIANGTAFSIAGQLAAPYGITVQSTAGSGPKLQQFNILLGETPWEIIDRVTRYSDMLVYDMPDGSIMLAKVGTTSMASGFALGKNVEQGDVNFSMDGRFSEYEGHLTSVLTFGTDAGINTPTLGGVVKDVGVPRFRKRYVISEQFVQGQPLAQARAVWEMNRRKGQSFQFNVTCDSWRDSAGALWDLNKLAPIQAAALKLANASYLIGAITYTRDESGQHAQLTLMPPEAYAVEPSVQPGPITNSDAQNFNPTKPPGGSSDNMGKAEVIPT
jgi:prophage tail gpP-like protein